MKNISLNISSKSLLINSKEFFERNIMIVICIVLMIICTFASDRFLTVPNLLSILRQNSIIGVMAVGQCIVIIAGGIDASIAPMMVAGVMVMGLVQGLPMFLVILIVMAFTFLMGTISGIIVSYYKVVPFIATMAMATIAEGISLIVNRGKPIYWQGEHQEFIKVMGTGSVLGVPNMVIALVTIVIIGQLILTRTKLGFTWRAIGGNAEASYWSGIKSKRYSMLAYSFSSMMAGVASVLMITRVGASDPMAGITNTMDVLAASVLGGTFIGGKGVGSVTGALLGVFILGMINNIFNLVGFSAYAQYITKGMILILAVAFGSSKRK